MRTDHSRLLHAVGYTPKGLSIPGTGDVRPLPACLALPPQWADLAVAPARAEEGT
jgi:hypothetical protein